MKINKAKTSNYDQINNAALVDYIQDYALTIFDNVSVGNEQVKKQLASCDRTQLKAIAAELETVQKRLNWILYGRC